MENHTKYGDTIYFHDRRRAVRQSVHSSALTWKEKGIVVRQTTRFPEEEATHLAFTAEQPTRLALKIRQPAWATSGVSVTINNAAARTRSSPPTRT